MREVFCVNDSVFYGVHGVCVITDIARREFGGKTQEYYVLTPAFSKHSTIFVPTDSPGIEKRMRKTAAKKEITELLDNMKDVEPEWSEHALERKEKYAEILKKGSLKDICGMIKALYDYKDRLLSENRKKMYASDEKQLAEAEKVLFEEAAFALKTDLKTAEDKIKKAIHKSK